MPIFIHVTKVFGYFLAAHRESVLFELGLIVNDFVYQVTAEQQPQEVARLCVAKLFTYGSYRLGAHSEDSDIDTLCVCPRHIWREHFFTRLSDILRRRPEVSELTVSVAI